LPDSALEPEDFHVEHIIARKHGGLDGDDNLAWACIFCNLYKGPNLSSFDPDSGELTRLFHPRRDRWEELRHASSTLNVTILPKPFDNETLREALQAGLCVPRDEHHAG
jgi:hypothetical protein